MFPGAKRYPLILLAGVAMTSCAADPARSCSPSLSKSEAAALASAAASSAGYVLADWHQPDVEFELGESNCTWTVTYISKSSTMPGHFGAIVDDRTRKVSLHGGE